MSQTMMRTIPINVILPVDKLVFSGEKKRSRGPFKTLYLLHGMFGSYIDWIAGTDIQRLAEARNLAVVMPSGDNQFYLDSPETGSMYGEFIGRELVELTRAMFPLSENKEDTFIGGLSMGGFGALRNGLKYNDTFGRVIALSSGVMTDEMISGMSNNTDFGGMNVPPEMRFANVIMMKMIKERESDINPEWLAKNKKEHGEELPSFYVACGTEDPLLSGSRHLKESFENLGIDVTYDEDTGAHNWDFWNKELYKIMKWLPVDKVQEGFNSGNIVF